MSSNFDHNFIKKFHTVKYHDVFLEFYICLYGLIPSSVIALCDKKSQFRW